MRQTSCPEKTRNLANRDLDLGHIDLAAQPLVDVIRGRGLDEQRQGFGQILSSLAHDEPLARDIDLRAQSHIALAFPLAGRLSSRALSCWFYAHPAVHSEMLSHPNVVASGVSALNDHRVDLVVSDQTEAYVPQSRVAELADRFALDADSGRPNVRLRVVSDDDWPFEASQRVAPVPVVAVDLLDSDDERFQRAGRELLART